MVDWPPYQTAMLDRITIHHQFWGGVNKCSDRTDMDPNFSDRGAGFTYTTVKLTIQQPEMWLATDCRVLQK